MWGEMGVNNEKSGKLEKPKTWRGLVSVKVCTWTVVVAVVVVVGRYGWRSGQK